MIIKLCKFELNAVSGSAPLAGAVITALGTVVTGGPYWYWKFNDAKLHFTAYFTPRLTNALVVCLGVIYSEIIKKFYRFGVL